MRSITSTVVQDMALNRSPYSCCGMGKLCPLKKLQERRGIFMTKVKDCLNETNGEHLESSHALPRGKWTGSHEKGARKVRRGVGTGLCLGQNLEKPWNTRGGGSLSSRYGLQRERHDSLSGQYVRFVRRTTENGFMQGSSEVAPPCRWP